MDVAQLLIWFLFKYLKLKRCAVSGSKNYCFFFSFLVEVEAFFSVQPPFWSPFFRWLWYESTGVTFGSSERSIHLNASLRKLQCNSLWWISTSHTNLCSALHIPILCFIHFLKCPQNQCDAITLTIIWFCETKLVFSLKMSSVIKISSHPGTVSYGMAISHFGCTFLPFFFFSYTIVILWVKVLWKWCITWPKYKKHPA